jgi:hypothetical protein
MLQYQNLWQKEQEIKAQPPTKCISHKGGGELQRFGTLGKPLAPGDVNAPKPLTAHTLERCMQANVRTKNL